MTEKEKQHIVAEVNILRELKHPNIVRYYDRIIDKKNTKIYIVMEYCEGGDIGALIKRCKKNCEYIAEDVIWKIFTQIVLALHECHTRKEGKILHRDLKPSNVFLDKENNVKLGDFGLSRVLSTESSFAYSHVGTPYYMSPEQIDEAKYNEKSDIWSLGCYLYELTTFNPPFEATNHLSLALKIKSGKVERINSRYSEELSRVINWLMLVDQDKRPTVEDLLNLPQVSLRLRERRLKDTMTKLKKIEENLKQKENHLTEKENELNKREQALSERESLLNKREADLKETRIKPFKHKEEDKKAENINQNNSKLDVDGQYSKNNYVLDHQISPEKIKHKEIDNITYSINSQINQNTMNLNYLNLLNNKDININYNINNKIKFENNYEMFTDRLKEFAENNRNKSENYQETNRGQTHNELKTSKENIIPKIHSTTNLTDKSYNYYPDIITNKSNQKYENINIIAYNDNKSTNKSSNNIPIRTNQPEDIQDIDYNNKYTGNLYSHDSDITHKNTLIGYKDKNFNFDPSLYRENPSIKHANSNSVSKSIPIDLISTPNSKFQKTQNNNHILNHQIENRDNVYPCTLPRPPNRMVFTSSPVISNSKNFISKNQLKYVSHAHGENNYISTITSTPQISNRVTSNNISVTKSSLISNNNQTGNINKYSSILTRDRSFSPSAASNYKGKHIRPPLSFINNK